MTKNWIPLALVLVLIATPAFAKKEGAIPFQKISISVLKKERTAWILGPKKINPKIKYSVLFVLHGAHGTGQGMAEISGLKNSYLNRAEKWIFVFPDGYKKRWQDSRQREKLETDDSQFFDLLFNAIQKRFSVDQDRVFMTGLSNGGLMAFEMGCKKDWVSGIAPVAANLPETLKPNCSLRRMLPVLHIVGKNDPLVPFWGGEITGPFGALHLGRVLSAEETIQFWAKKNGCDTSKPDTHLISKTPEDSTEVLDRQWKNCKTAASLRQIVVIHGGHTWPGGVQYLKEWVIGKTTHHLNASQIILDFFERL